MTEKEKRIVVIRDTIYTAVHSLLSVIRMLVVSRRPSRLDYPEDLLDEVVILGNGPTLGPFLQEHQPFLEGKAKISVNHYAISSHYEEVKPEIYVISSPEFFLTDEFEAYADRKRVTLSTMASKTTWPMSLYVPMFAKPIKEWKRHFEGHDHIRIAYFNNTPVDGALRLRLWAMSHQMGMPRPHNVIVPCIAIAAYIGFKRLYLAGTEHSWLKEITVDDDNKVLVSQKHFYDKEAAKVHKGPPPGSPQPMFKGIRMEKRRLHELLEKFYLTFKSYWELKPYLDRRGVEVINISPSSYIDAFTKRSIEELQAEEKSNNSIV